MPYMSTGKIKSTEGLKPLFQVVAARPDLKHSVLRILSPAAAGSMSIIDGAFITGAQVAAGQRSGYAAVRELLAVTNGVYSHFEPADMAEFQKLDSGLKIPLQELMIGNPQQAFDELAAQNGWTVPAPEPEPSTAAASEPTPVQQPSSTSNPRLTTSQPTSDKGASSQRLAATRISQPYSRDRLSESQKLRKSEVMLAIHEPQTKAGRIDKATLMGAAIVAAIVAGVLGVKMLVDYNSPQRLVDSAKKYLANNQPDLAATQLSLALIKDPSNNEYLMLRAQAYDYAGDLESALEDLDKVVKANGSNVTMEQVVRRAHLFYLLKKYQEGEEACREGLKRDSANKSLATLHGMCLARLGRYDEALKALSNPAPDLVSQADLEKGYALYKLNKLKEALRQYQLASANPADPAQVAQEKSLVEQDIGNQSRTSRGSILALAQASPIELKALAKSGVDALQAGNARQAADDLSVAIQRVALDTRTRKALAYALMKSGDERTAYEHFLALEHVGALSSEDKHASEHCKKALQGKQPVQQ